ncbi:MAG TPA: TlyA family RNA methyltransferase [Clostridiaceae bacterium]|nr:TlyA family RNA methyltransferase [Clostridiaceae bacterium]
MSKVRLDVLLVEKGLFQSREKARASIMAGVVYVNGIREDKPGARFERDVEISVKRDINPYVSRGGLKLEKALDTFNIDLRGKKAIDVGASTGGFTDCMLKRGVEKVIAIDVGYGQLAWELRNDERVICMERTNIRYVKPEDVQFIADFAVIDVSFISLKKVLPAVINLIGAEGEIVSLIKPQFEAGREKVGKGGVVREKETHIEVIEEIVDTVIELGLFIKGLTYSPIKGPEGNIEYLLYSSKKTLIFDRNEFSKLIKETVMEAHEKVK